MKGKGFLIIIIIILVILNAGTLLFIWTHHPVNGNPPLPRRNVAEFLIRELKLTLQQKDQYLMLRERHRIMMNAYQQKDQALHNRFFDLLLSVPEDSLLVHQLADSMSFIRENMEMITFDHFRKIRAILTDEQKEKFDSLFHQTLKLVLPQPPPPPPPPPPSPPIRGR